jgi:hypothetical protein
MGPDTGSAHRSVLFVCAHGAARSRVAAAFFNQKAPPGWWASSAGVEPQEQLGETARRLLEGTGAESLLDITPPRALDAAAHADRTIAIDCTVAGAEQWRLTNQEFGAPMREELRRRAQALAARVASNP